MIKNIALPYALLGSMVLVSATAIVTYTATASFASASCSVSAPQQDDDAMKRFMEGDPVPMQGGKRY